MAFKTTAVSKNDNADKPQINFEEVNEYRVKTAGLEQRETLVGYVAGIVDLGSQEQPDAEFIFTGSEEDQQAEIEKNPNTYFKEGFDPISKKQVTYKCYPQRPVQAVCLAIDFPDIILDIGQFYGKSNPQPLRMFTGAQFWNGSAMIVARPTYLKINKSTGQWSFDAKHLLYKMAVADKLVKPGEPFLPQSIDALLGKSFQFEAQVFFKESKGKKYYTEYLKFVGGLGRGQQPHEPVNEPFLIEFDGDLTPEVMSNLRSHIINTIKQANNYEGSKIAEFIENRQQGSSTPKQEEKPAVKSNPPAAKKVAPKAPVVEEDDDIPF